MPRAGLPGSSLRRGGEADAQTAAQGASCATAQNLVACAGPGRSGASWRLRRRQALLEQPAVRRLHVDGERMANRKAVAAPQIALAPWM